jgi:hypothetical protein
MQYRIQLGNRDASQYGNCEVCNKPTNQTFKQQWRKSSEAKGWITGLFGHYQCLNFGNYAVKEI